MNVFHIIAKILLSLILLLPSLGLMHIFPAPTRDLYNSDVAFAFIQMIMGAAIYIDIMMVTVLILGVILLWTKREALGAILIAPVTANVIGFHLFLDGGVFNGGSVPALLMMILNLYIFYKNRATIALLFKQRIIS